MHNFGGRRSSQVNRKPQSGKVNFSQYACPSARLRTPDSSCHLALNNQPPWLAYCTAGPMENERPRLPSAAGYPCHRFQCPAATTRRRLRWPGPGSYCRRATARRRVKGSAAGEGVVHERPTLLLWRSRRDGLCEVVLDHLAQGRARFRRRLSADARRQHLPDPQRLCAAVVPGELVGGGLHQAQRKLLAGALRLVAALRPQARPHRKPRPGREGAGENAGNAGGLGAIREAEQRAGRHVRPQVWVPDLPL